MSIICLVSWLHNMMHCPETDCMVLFLRHAGCKRWLYPQVLTVFWNDEYVWEFVRVHPGRMSLRMNYERLFVCFYLMSVFLWWRYAPQVFLWGSPAQSVSLYSPCNTPNHLRSLDLFTQQNKFPPLHGYEVVSSCLSLFLWQQRERETWKGGGVFERENQSWECPESRSRAS